MAERNSVATGSAVSTSLRESCLGGGFSSLRWLLGSLATHKELSLLSSQLLGEWIRTPFPGWLSAKSHSLWLVRNSWWVDFLPAHCQLQSASVIGAIARLVYQKRSPI